MNRLQGMIVYGIAAIALAACAPRARDDAAAPAQATAAAAPQPATASEAAAPAQATGETEAKMTGQSLFAEPSAWTLTDGGRAELKTAAAAQITLSIADGQLSGYGGCNQYNASVTVDGDQVTIGPVAATKRGCPGEAGATEQAYFAALGAVNAAHLGGDTLELRLADGGTLRFARSTSVP